MFFFKQKTAYEMRISDWSSDVCSSDLDGPDRADDASTGDHRVRSVQLQPEHPDRRADAATDQQSDPDAPEPGNEPHQSGEEPDHHQLPRIAGAPADDQPNRPADGARSEEHTSELQSLMRISYAVFYLKKKNKKTN